MLWHKVAGMGKGMYVVNATARLRIGRRYPTRPRDEAPLQGDAARAETAI
jgi:uncharacterized MAPEG superfamily protein